MSPLLLLLGMLAAAAVLFSGCATPEARAVRRGDIEDLEKFLAKGGDVNEPQRDGRTLLHVAAEYGQSESLEFLLANGAEPDPRDPGGITPFYLTMAIGRVDMGRSLLEAGADLRTETSELRTPLFPAAAGGHAEAVEFLLDFGLDPDHRDAQGRNPLHMLGKNSLTGIAGTLIAEGADVTARSSSGSELPVHTAASAGAYELVELYVRASSPEILSAEDSHGDRPLHRAMNSSINSRSSLNTMDSILSLGADPAVPDGEDRLPVRIAVEELDSRHLQLLLGYGASLPRYVRDGRPGKSAQRTGLLHIAARRGTDDTGRILLERGTDPDLIDDDGDTALMISVREEKWDFFQLLIQYNANPNIFDMEGKSPLLVALNRSSLQSEGLNSMTQTLIQRGGVLPNNYSLLIPVLENAVANENIEVARLLFNRGISGSAAGEDGEPLIFTAVRNADADMLELLLIAGADPNARNEEGLTPIMLLGDNTKLGEIRDILLRAGAIDPDEENSGTAGSEESEDPTKKSEDPTKN
ncbi:ankyrin repeat domain-containing protein [Salinispira pacifica]|uniref:Uncharacterized protein n=1 Tax=Salinispira pacifica TaxID=1307761 RepID=V5WHD3_9SPIO|nr:ankyrin repeat domain-containing protein [Salinispira pacifica]AHC14964.1 hypothetical protein L21SP2_1575 [Salinispira pacifica]